MNSEKVEAAALKLDLKDRARLAGQLREDLESQSPEEDERLWAEEAQCRDQALAAGTLSSRPARMCFVIFNATRPTFLGCDFETTFPPGLQEM